MTPMMASILMLLLAFVGILGGGDPTVGPVHALLGLILQFCGDRGSHAVSGPPAHQLLHFNGCMTARWVGDSVKLLCVCRRVNQTTVDEDAISFCHHFQGLTQEVPHHLLQDLLPNARRIMAGHLDDGADSAIGDLRFANLARVERRQLGQQMLHLGLVIEVFDPSS